MKLHLIIVLVASFLAPGCASQSDRIIEAVEDGSRLSGVASESGYGHTQSIYEAFGPTADVPDRYEVVVIGGWRQAGVADPKLYAWIERFSQADGQRLNAGILRMARYDHRFEIIHYWPLDSIEAYDGRVDLALEAAADDGLLPRDVEAFVRPKLAESR